MPSCSRVRASLRTPTALAKTKGRCSPEIPNNVAVLCLCDSPMQPPSRLVVA